jgi:tRNA(Arg) A34 adenosine deaminase TadA
MKNEQIVLCVVQAKRQQLGTDAAVLVEIDKNGPKYLGFGKQGAAAHERPVVVLLQGRDAGSAPNRIVATTTPPDESEIGMAWKYGIDRIIFWEGGAGKQVKISNDGSKFAPQALTLTGEFQLWAGVPAAAFPAPLNDEKAKDWLAALNKKTGLTTAGTRAKEAFAKDPFTGRVAVREIFDRGLDGTPAPGLAKQPFADMVFMHLAFALVQAGWRSSDKEHGDGGYNIGSILVDPTQKIIAWGLNLVEENKSFHAETLMIQSYLKRANVAALPANCVMYTSLESCHMCAGFAASVGNGLRVVYGQKDDQIINNALERKINASSQARSMITFTPAGMPARLAGKDPLKPGPAISALDNLKKEYVALDKFKGVTKFLFSDLGKYFYDIEAKMPGQTVSRLGDIAKAPVLPGRAPPLPVQTGKTPPPSFLDLAMPKPKPGFVDLSKPRPGGNLAGLDLALPTKSPTQTQREAYNNTLFGNELSLAAYALKFLDTLRLKGVFTV